MYKIMLNTLKWMNISSGKKAMSNCVLHLKQKLVGQQLFSSAIFDGFISFISKPTDLTLYFAETCKHVCAQLLQFVKRSFY